MRALVLLAKISAVLAGILLTFITVMTCASIVGRELFGSAITGDFELSGAATGAAIAMFMPWCQAKRGNIIVDFFTAGCSQKTNAVLTNLKKVEDIVYDLSMLQRGGRIGRARDPEVIAKDDKEGGAKEEE
jgi:TRAP-type C4-dicarboxylate transport system permease small subunit